ncbi:MAG: chromosome segregation ATPase [Moritella sp.]|uniref:chromosome segregation ATPase n=1 Tax=Moritella sp. TaxID=78556 RepID=UPI0029A0A3EC|nr:chromosome segregation ATPase [Moritella sp.]MDX2320826.1 chromosome segregation ATPase [Moritella sp.]
MRAPLILVSVAFIGSVYLFITNENELNSVENEQAIPKAPHLTAQPTATTSSQVKDKAPVNKVISEQETLLQQAEGQVLMTALTSFWQQCLQQRTCDEMLAQQQLILDEHRYQLLVHFPEHQQEEQRLMGESLISQDATLADKIANVNTIREQVWGDDAKLLFAEQDAYYNYRLSIADPNNLLSQTQNSDDFMHQYSVMLAEWGDDLATFGLDSDNAKYEEAVKLIPPSMPENEVARIMEQLAKQYLTANTQQAIASRAEQVDKQHQDVSDYQQGLNELEAILANERATSKQALSDEEWQVYKADRLYQYRLGFFSP